MDQSHSLTSIMVIESSFAGVSKQAQDLTAFTAEIMKLTAGMKD